MGDIQQCYNTLLEACCEYEVVELVSRNPYADVHYSVRHALVICIFNLCVLGEIGNSKSNVIAVSKIFVFCFKFPKNTGLDIPLKCLC